MPAEDTLIKRENRKKVPDNSLEERVGHRSRLRERFLNGGSHALADYELLEMLLFAAHPRGDVKPLAKALLREFKTVPSVIHAAPEQLKKVDGMGKASIAALKVVEATMHRSLQRQIEKQPILSSWHALLDYCHAVMGYRKTEEFRIFFLNNKNELLADEKQQEGTIDHTPVYVREVVRRGLELGASAMILAHNHPSGDTTPSQADVDMTQKIIMAAAPLGITVHDHIIISKNGHYSFKSHQLI